MDKLTIISRVTNPSTYVKTPSINNSSSKTNPCEIFVDEKFAMDMKCGICMNVVYDVRKCIPNNEGKGKICGHLFCATCLASWTAGHSKCPMCDVRIQKTERHKETDEQLAGANIQCINDGCDWTGKLGEKSCNYYKHRSQCQFQMTKCRECDETMLRKFMSNHKKKCKQQMPKKCRYHVIGCTKHSTSLKTHERKDIQDHIDLMVKQIRAFDQKYKKTGVFGVSHLKKDMMNARKVMNQCPFYDIGCRFKDEEESVELHESQFAEYHLDQLTRILYDKINILHYFGKKFLTGKKVNATWRQIGGSSYPGYIKDVFIDTALHDLRVHIKYDDGDVNSHAPWKHITGFEKKTDGNFKDFFELYFPEFQFELQATTKKITASILEEDDDIDIV